MTDLDTPGPSQVFVFLDEHADSIDDGAFIIKPGYPHGQESWRNLPVSYHNGAGSFSFADGHVELHAWLEKGGKNKTIYPVRMQGLANAQPWNKRVRNFTSRDYEWVEGRMPYHVEKQSKQNMNWRKPMSYKYINLQVWPRLARQARYNAVAMARLLGISPRQLRRLTTKHFGPSTRTWLNEQLFRFAVELLKESESIKWVACELGMSESNFAHRFKRRFGVSPSEFLAQKQQIRAQQEPPNRRIRRHNGGLKVKMSAHVNKCPPESTAFYSRSQKS